MIYKLIALPTAQTTSYLMDVFQGAPVQINFEALRVEIGSSRSLIEPNDIETVYRAVPGLMDVWYDTATARSYWILPLIPSPELAEAHDQIGDAWDREYVPFMVISEVQNMERRRAAWMRSVASSLAATRPIFTFTAEMVLEDAAIMPEHHDFYESYLAKGMMNNDLFIDLNDTED